MTKSSKSTFVYNDEKWKKLQTLVMFLRNNVGKTKLSIQVSESFQVAFCWYQHLFRVTHLTSKNLQKCETKSEYQISEERINHYHRYFLPHCCHDYPISSKQLGKKWNLLTHFNKPLYTYSTIYKVYPLFIISITTSFVYSQSNVTSTMYQYFICTARRKKYDVINKSDSF